MSEADTRTAREAALESLPPSWRERLIEHARDAGIYSDNDVGWLLVGSVINAWSSAAAAGRASESVEASLQLLEQSVAALPETATQAVVRASQYAGSQAAQKIESTADNAVEQIRDELTTARDADSQERQGAWGQMLEDYDRSIAKVRTKHSRDIESHVTAAAERLAKAQHHRSVRLTLLSGVLSVLVGIGIALGGFWYAYSDRIAQQPIGECARAEDGATWCRLKPASGR